MLYCHFVAIFFALRSALSAPVQTIQPGQEEVRSKRASNSGIVPAEYNRNLYQGDIVVHSDPSNMQREATLRENTWPNGVVPYTIEISDSEGAAMIEEAMKEFMQRTCVKFVPKTSNDEYFIRIVANDGCSSTVGRSSFTSSGQDVSLSDGCYNPGTIRHELMHTLGFYHEQSRTDRDDYVKILYENIQDGLEDQFAKNNAREVTDLGSPYDYGSLMHYSYNAFSRDESLPTITKIDGSTTGFGQRKGFSDIDLFEINKLYNCPGTGSIGGGGGSGSGGRRPRPDGSETTTIATEITTERRFGHKRPHHNHNHGGSGSGNNNGGNGGGDGQGGESTFGGLSGFGTGETGGFGSGWNNGGFGSGWNHGGRGGSGSIDGGFGSGTGETGGFGSGWNSGRGGGSTIDGGFGTGETEGVGNRRNNGAGGRGGGETSTFGGGRHTGGETSGTGDGWFDKWFSSAKEHASSFFGDHLGSLFGN